MAIPRSNEAANRSFLAGETIAERPSLSLTDCAGFPIDRTWMSIKTRILLFVFALGGFLPYSHLGQSQRPDKEYKLTVDVNLISVTVTVTREDGTWVPDLAASDFRVFDDGIEQKISLFGRESDQPLQLCLLFDSSFSISPELKTQQEAAIEFLKSTLRPVDRVTVLRISEEVDEMIHKTNQMERLVEAIRSIKPGGGTSLYDGVFLASEILRSSKGRRVILVISDGTDTTSHTKFQDCVKKAQNSESVVYSLIVQPIKSEPGRNLAGEHAMMYLSGRTGGRYFGVSLSDNFRASFETISQELRTQYVIGYYPQDSSPRDYRKIEVRVDNPAFQVRARDGYFVSVR
ncbi:MAG: VWA domain-containing protein [Terriglobia bacterium]